MGRIDPPPVRGGRGAAPGKVLLGILAVLAVALGSYELGKRASSPPPAVPSSPIATESPPTARPSQTAVADPIVPGETGADIPPFVNAAPSPGLSRAEVEVTAPPGPEPATQPPPSEAPDLPETPREKMARCLSFLVENDEIHLSGYSPLATPVKVTATNRCSFSFEGPDVSVEVRAIPLYGEGTMARVVGRFQDPIPSRGRSETQMLLPCPRCDEVTHRYEARVAP